jgi:hypothetical protein
MKNIREASRELMKKKALAECESTAVATFTGNNLPTQKATDENITISVYVGDTLDKETAITVSKKLVNAFPQITEGVISTILDRMIDLKFTNKRAIDAVNNVIDNCKFNAPAVANFIDFDKRVKLYTYSDMLTKVREGSGSSVWEQHQTIRKNGVVYWISKKDLI